MEDERMEIEVGGRAMGMARGWMEEEKEEKTTRKGRSEKRKKRDSKNSEGMRDGNNASEDSNMSSGCDM
jgi:hypothetical protein